MDSILLVLTAVSMLAALGFGLFARRLLSEQRRRSAARVAMLSSAIDDAELTPQAPVMVSSLFAPEHSVAARGVPVIRLAVGLIMGTILVLVAVMSNWHRVTGAQDESGASRAVSARGTAPLELISLRHTRDGDRLTVSGLVRTPRTGSGIARVTAVVFAFSRAGAFVTSARAALDFTTLAPGDESPFVVTMPGVPDVGRYRVSFRTDSGIVQHVDRRAEQMRLATSVLPQ